MPRKRLNWLYDDDKQEFLTPSGRRISLHEIAGLLQDRAECCFDFEGPWAGWRMRGAALIPPRSTIHGPHLKPHNLAAFLRWRAPVLPDRGAFIASTPHQLPVTDQRINSVGAVGHLDGTVDHAASSGALVARR
jgi:hypothetical protein